MRLNAGPVSTARFLEFLGAGQYEAQLTAGREVNHRGSGHSDIEEALAGIHVASPESPDYLQEKDVLRVL